jgi:hypothetical protein
MIPTVKTTTAREVTRAITRSGDAGPGLVREAWRAVDDGTKQIEGGIDHEASTNHRPVNLAELIVNGAARGVFQRLDIDAVVVAAAVGRVVQNMKQAVEPIGNHRKRKRTSSVVPSSPTEDITPLHNSNREVMLIPNELRATACKVLQNLMTECGTQV